MTQTRKEIASSYMTSYVASIYQKKIKKKTWAADPTSISQVPALYLSQSTSLTNRETERERGWKENASKILPKTNEHKTWY